MTIKASHRVISHPRVALLPNHQIFIKMREACRALSLDQTQKHIKLQCLSIDLVVPTDVQHRLTFHQPVSGHDVRTTAQQIDIGTWSNDADQATINITLHFVGGNRQTRRRRAQLYLQRQHPPSAK
ncbi:hypothetical protein D3C75_1144130 [compost metagenome]